MRRETASARPSYRSPIAPHNSGAARRRLVGELRAGRGIRSRAALLGRSTGSYRPRLGHKARDPN